MVMPTQPLLEIMRRSMANLAFVEARATPDGPYEVTQLINTFLGALAHPFEAMRDDLMVLPLTQAVALGWPAINREDASDREPASLGDLIRLMRNAMAHGNIEYLSDDNGQIHALRVQNTHPQTGGRMWGAVVKVADMRRFLTLFVDLIEHCHQERGRQKRGAA